MDPITQQTTLAAAGAGGDKVYVEDVFSTYLYDGNGGTQSINNGLDLAGEGGLVWTKPRGDNATHALWDTERGATKWIRSNGSNSESTNSGLTSFNSDGFTLGSYAIPNQNTIDYASWSFRKAPGFFDVVTWTGNGTAGRQIAHNLGSVPGMIIIKNLDSSYDWSVYHRSLANTHYMRLNNSEVAESTNNYWNSTTATSTHFTLGDHGSVNNNNDDFVAYVFAHDEPVFGTNEDESIIKCGSYTGAYSNTAEVDLGWEPQWLMIKSSSSSSSPWLMFDNMRAITNVAGGGDRYFEANESNTEYVNSSWGDVSLTATGFTISGDSGWMNNYGSKYTYMAIRRPHKPPQAATEVFAIDTWGGTSPTPPTFTSGFPVDIGLRIPTGSTNKIWASRMKGIYFQKTNSDSAEDYASSFRWDYMNGWASGTGTDSAYYSYMFKRAPGFMDAVAYTGTGSARTIAHSLGSVPGMILIKSTSSYDWRVYHSFLGKDYYGGLNSPAAFQPESGTGYVVWNNTDPTSSVFSVGTAAPVNANGVHYAAYIFATLPGISKVGGYTGTGSDINVDCGFTNGARFVLIKRTDSTADWFLYDTVRGISSGNDPYFKINQGESQVTNTDYIDPLSSGFIANGNSADINTSGGTYIFLAIA